VYQKKLDRYEYDILAQLYKTFFNLNKMSQISSILEDSCFYSSLPAEAVTIAILKYASFHSWCWLMNRKVKSFKQSLFYRNSVQCQKLGQVFEVQSFGFDTGP